MVHGHLTGTRERRYYVLFCVEGPNLEVTDLLLKHHTFWNLTVMLCISKKLFSVVNDVQKAPTQKKRIQTRRKSVGCLIFVPSENTAQTFAGTYIRVMSANSQQNSKKYGNKSLSINVPPQSGSFLASFYGIDEGFKQQENNMVQHLAAGIVGLDGITKKQKTSDRTFAANRSPAMSLEKAIHLGHDEDIVYLMSQTEGNNNSLVVFNVFKFGFMIPQKWKDERQKRCGRWLVENLGFKESLIGDSFTYTHDKAKVTIQHANSFCLFFFLFFFNLYFFVL